MGHYYLRLDDASEYMDLDKWLRMEKLLDKYNIKPIFGIIPQNTDLSMVNKYQRNDRFWQLVHKWIRKEWTPALHGCEHRYVTQNGGINPINFRSEFAGLPYDVQEKKIKRGYNILLKHDIKPEVFFAPSHSFDMNTLKAIKAQTPIRVISDTIAWDMYTYEEFIFIPQQCGCVRKLPFKTITFCYHPNSMTVDMYAELEEFINSHRSDFQQFNSDMKVNRRQTILDFLIRKLYFLRRKMKK